MLSVSYLFEEFINPARIQQGMALTPRTSYDIKAGQVKVAKDYSGKAAPNPMRQQAASLRNTMR